MYAHLVDFATVKSCTLLIHPTLRDIFAGFYPPEKNYDGIACACAM